MQKIFFFYYKNQTFDVPPLTPYNQWDFFGPKLAAVRSKILVTNTAVIKFNTTPTPSVNAKDLIEPVPSTYKIIAAINVVMFPSITAVIALLNPTSMAPVWFFLFLILLLFFQKLLR